MQIVTGKYGEGAKDSELKSLGLERARKLSSKGSKELASFRKKHAMAKKIVGMKDEQGGKQDANRAADSFSLSKPVAQ